MYEYRYPMVLNKHVLFYSRDHFYFKRIDTKRAEDSSGIIQFKEQNTELGKILHQVY